jgi:DNA-binding GntR family transcriptional regulator
MRSKIFEVRIELEPLALAAIRANERDISALDELIEKTKLAAKADDLEEFFESHLNFRNKF